MGRSRRLIRFHGRSGHPVVHKTKTGRKFMMVRKRGGGTRRLYEGSRYSPTKGGKATKVLRL